MLGGTRLEHHLLFFSHFFLGDSMTVRNRIGATRRTIGNNLPPFFGCAHRCVLSLAPRCRYSNTHPNPLQNPLGVCVPVYTNCWARSTATRCVCSASEVVGEIAGGATQRAQTSNPGAASPRGGPSQHCIMAGARWACCVPGACSSGLFFNTCATLLPCSASFTWTIDQQSLSLVTQSFRV